MISSFSIRKKKKCFRFEILTNLGFFILFFFSWKVQFTEALAAIQIFIYSYGAQNDSKEILEIKC